MSPVDYSLGIRRAVQRGLERVAVLPPLPKVLQLSDGACHWCGVHYEAKTVHPCPEVPS